MEFVIVGTSAAVAGIVQNIAGFGAGIILMMILPHFYGVLGAPAESISPSVPSLFP